MTLLEKAERCAGFIKRWIIAGDNKISLAETDPGLSTTAGSLELENKQLTERIDRLEAKLQISNAESAENGADK